MQQGQQQNQPYGQPQQAQPYETKPRRKRGGFRRLLRGYLMIVGALTTVYVLIRLLTLLLVEIQKWMPPAA